MINWLHTFTPESVLISFGNFKIHYYGIFIVLGLILGTLLLLKLSDYYKLNKQNNLDALFWIIINAIIGARLYHIFLELPFYLEYPLQSIKVWEGGLAIHGAIIGGVLTVWYYAKKFKIPFWQLTAIIVPGLSLGQALGRWGNYFNQELYGLPTDLPWGIPIDFENRLAAFSGFKYFHPTFLYESIGNLIIFLIIMLLHYKTKNIKSNFFQNNKFTIITLSYLILYSLLRFSLEFVRIDPTPSYGLKVPQIVSLGIVVVSIAYIGLLYKKNRHQK